MNDTLVGPQVLHKAENLIMKALSMNSEQRGFITRSWHAWGCSGIQPFVDVLSK